MRLRLRHLSFVIASSVLAVATVVACGSNDDSSEKHTGFDGVYTTDTDGVIGAIAFANNTDYMLMSSNCYQRECTEFGTFVYDEDGKTLTLTEATTRAVKTLPVDVLEKEGYDGANTLSTRDFVGTDASLLADTGVQVSGDGGTKLLDGGDASLLDGGDASLLDGGGQKLVNPKPTELVKKAKVGKQTATKAETKPAASSSSSSGSSGTSSSSSGSSGSTTAKDAAASSSSSGSSGTSSSGGVTITINVGGGVADAGKAATASDAGDAGTITITIGQLQCLINVPTARSTPEDILEYFIRCPGGIRGF